MKEDLELKKNIRDNLLSERTGEQQLQTDLSKFYRPITETQKASAREIMEGLKPIREGIENLPQAITFPPTQPLGEASGEATPENLGETAYNYLHKMPPNLRDTTFGIRIEKGLYYIGNKQVTIADNNIMVDDEKFVGTPGLWELLMSKRPNDNYYTYKDYDNYKRSTIKTSALHQNYDPNNPHPRSSKGPKWELLGNIWAKREKYEGKGVVVIPSNPNALSERPDLLLASQKAGYTGVRNELVSICDELKRQGVLDTESYKKLISDIKK